MEVREITEFLDGTEVITERSKVIYLDTNSNVAQEDPLVKDIANGTLRTPQRKAARDAIRLPHRTDDPVR